MVKKFCKLLKNQRGLTLVELLAVVVILGIISAIAVPSIGGLINNSKKDAHIANAQTMVNAVKLMVTTSELDFTSDVATVELGQLEKENYIDKVKNPSGGDYSGKSVITVTKTIGKDNSISYSYNIILKGGNPEVIYIGKSESNTVIGEDPFNLKRSQVKL
ncbi:type II secretion system protein [Lederbergia wuyishanensis]|uniref:Type IV pilus assembly protein PilA n=1 Tax=Lederbergia wuyishanensis TaxID=1347903 RepID=A0ABU0D1V3_9BACI|nr:prepilin-type N-terminal cleavage/methylation domain-containing protein [Lederbergia wuyishanensis]MCJ8006990.1 prepilin-type N-terminal cleavage/methylation domain-containing protein [Lederbergia wuyishanensis]MDQ0342374.1 type IV pilus assembly protein PilA [Lederbergia wuyishanensis]